MNTRFTIYNSRFISRASRRQEALTHSRLNQMALLAAGFRPPSEDYPPSPWGEGWGEGESFGRKCRVVHGEVERFTECRASRTNRPFQRFNVSTFQRFQPAFTLIELLVVIAIAVIIASLIITAGNAMVRKSNLQRAESERDQLETAIDAYKAKYGFYPPGNASGNGLTNQLFYELLGTQPATNSGSGTGGFATLDSGNYIAGLAVQAAFGVNTFMNCNKGSGDDAIPAKTFLAGLKAGEIASNSVPSGAYTFIVTAANSDSVYTPMPGVYSLAGRPANPWRYVCPGTNNPNSYDLWVQVFVGNKTNLICNWASQPEINVPKP